MAQENVRERPRVLILDANVYLNLAKVPGNTPVLKAIEKAVRAGVEFELLVPEPVASAVAEHREEAIAGHWKIRRESLRDMKQYLADLAPDPAIFRQLADGLHENIKKAEAQLPDTVAAMDSLLAAGRVVACEPRHFADAGARFMQKKAPAHERSDKGRKHIAIFKDCLIWAVTREQTATSLVEFVSADTDFTSPTHNEKLHEELVAELEPRRLKFHTLDDFVKVHIKDAPAVVEAPPSSWTWPHFNTCPVCGSDKIGQALIPGPSASGYSYRQYCPSHGGYVDTGEPYDE
jgi:hypothetical protein